MTEQQLPNQHTPTQQRRSWGTIAASTFSILTLCLIVVVLGALVAGYRPVVITTGSMGDAAPVGSLIIAAPRAAADIAPGDVVVMRRADSSPITHRVIEIGTDATGPYVLTKGDANPDPDPTPYALSDEELVSRWVVPGLGSALQTLRDPRLLLGLLALLLVAATVITLRTIWSNDDEPHGGRRDSGRPAGFVPPPPGSGLPLPPPVMASRGLISTLRVAFGARHQTRRQVHHRVQRQRSPHGDTRFWNRNPHGMGFGLGAGWRAGHMALLPSGDTARNHLVLLAEVRSSGRNPALGAVMPTAAPHHQSVATPRPNQRKKQ